MSDDLRERALDLYKPPFKYHSPSGWIFDGGGKQVLDKIDETAVLCQSFIIQSIILFLVPQKPV